MKKNNKEEIWLSLGILCVGGYPAIGSIICWCTCVGNFELKRTMQSIFLLAGIIICWRLRRYWIIKENQLRQITFYGTAVTLFCLYLIIKYMYSPEAEITVYTNFSAAIVSVFFSQSVNTLVLSLTKCSKKNSELFESNTNNTITNDYSGDFLNYLIVAGWGLAALVWWRGSENTDGSVHLNMKSMPIMLGTYFMAIYSIVTWRSGILRMLLATPWLYLAICTTSRAVFALYLILILGSLLDIILKWRQSRENKRRVTTQMLSIVIMVCLVIVPACGNINTHYPYFESCGENTTTEWTSRMARTLRLFKIKTTFLRGSENSQNGILNTINYSASIQDDRYQLNSQNGILNTINYSASIQDDRYQLISTGLDLMATYPTGIWPQAIQIPTYVDVRDLSNNENEYTYPHNFFVELSLQFGWIPVLVVGAGLFLSLIYATQEISLANNSPNLFAGILFLSEFVRVQVSGDLTDGVGLLLLFIFITNRHFSDLISPRKISQSVL